MSYAITGSCCTDASCADRVGCRDHHDRSTARAGGLLRYGVAPDHPKTKRIGDRFATAYQHPRLTLHLNVEAGRGIADHALAELRRSKVREVVLLGRRGPENAAYSRGEFTALRHLEGVHVVVADDVQRDPGTSSSKTELLTGLEAENIDWMSPLPAGKRLVLRFHASVTELMGDHRVVAVRTTREGIPAGLVLRSIGSRGRPLPGLPFDPVTATIPHERGRVMAAAKTPPLGDRQVGTFASLVTDQ